MGCASSKILSRSGSYQEEIKQRLQGANGLEELLVSKSRGDQFLALLRNANTVAKNLKEESPKQQPEENSSTPLNLVDSESTDTKVPDDITNSSDGAVSVENIETIDARELLAGLEDDNGVEGEGKPQQQMHQSVEGTSTAGLPTSNLQTTEEYKYIVNNESAVPSKIVNSSEEKLEEDVSGTRSIRTVEDYDAMVANNSKGSCSYGDSESSIKECPMNSDHLKQYAEVNDSEQEFKNVKCKPADSIHSSSNDTTIVALDTDTTSKKLSKRVSMAKELGVLKIPSIEFSKSGSLRDWLLQGLAVSPGSPVTPKFGEFLSPYAKDGDVMFDASIFDPELVAHFEQAMKQLTMEEESILTQILSGLEGGNGEDISRIS